MTTMGPQLLGESRAIGLLRDSIARFAPSNVRVLISGETGVGKEVVAQSIHYQSTRATGVFAAVNCAALPETLLESELFGHVRGSFTGADRDRLGKLAVADKGTIFL